MPRPGFIETAISFVDAEEDRREALGLDHLFVTVFVDLDSHEDEPMFEDLRSEL